ncbi:O-methyltransferase [Amycolatopsis anabasis]|uniref:O-methyltransferase n=1 Tax=Amycolatopsis anabasis TaxID=1840409 RepID=UPI00131BDB30|nr:class I SAM-dependent methyltransferase [Amycolatopsis anabasis]
MNTLTTKPVRKVLDRLLAEERNDAEILAGIDVRVMHGEPDRGGKSVEELVELFGEAQIPVDAATGELLYLLARNRNARTVVEFGTSFGVSTLYLASALRDNGNAESVVITTELAENKVRAARANFAEACLDDLIDLREGDARQTLRDLPAAVDLLLIDGFPALYPDVLRLVEPSLARGALIVADGIPGGQDLIKPYLDYVREPANGYFSMALPLGDGIEVSLRV